MRSNRVCRPNIADSTREREHQGIILASVNKGRVLMLLLSCVSLFSAEPRQDNAGKKLAGAWRLVSVEGTDATFHFAYDHPTGMITYDRSGWMAVQIDVKGVRKPFVNGPAAGTVEEKADAFDNYFSYYGTCTLDLKAQTVTHQLEDASQPDWRGAGNVRWFEFQGNDRLLLIPREEGKGGVIDRKNATYKLL
jgi:hypothetical protein